MIYTHTTLVPANAAKRCINTTIGSVFVNPKERKRK